MASSARATTLTTAYRDEQVRNANLTALMAVVLWRRLVNPLDLWPTSNDWLRVLIPLLMRQRLKASRQSLLYIDAFRRLEMPGLDFDPLTPVEQVAQDIVEKSLRFTGPALLERKLTEIQRIDDTDARDIATRQAMTEAEPLISGTVRRHTANGARDQVAAAVKEDRHAIGWARVTDGDPCSFCALLAGRSYSYSKDSFDDSNERFKGEGSAKVHDHCGCHLEPRYVRDAPAIGDATAYDEIYRSLPPGLAGDDVLRAYRIAYNEWRDSRKN